GRRCAGELGEPRPVTMSRLVAADVLGGHDEVGRDPELRDRRADEVAVDVREDRDALASLLERAQRTRDLEERAPRGQRRRQRRWPVDAGPTTAEAILNVISSTKGLTQWWHSTCGLQGDTTGEKRLREDPEVAMVRSRLRP